MVAVAKPPLRADEFQRRLRLHLRRRMAGRRKNKSSRLHRPELGQRRQHRSRTRATQRTHFQSSVFFRRRKTHAFKRARIAGLALLRESAEGKDSVLVLANTDVEKENSITLALSELKIQISKFKIELLGQPLPKISAEKNKIVFTLEPGACSLSCANGKTHWFERRKLPPRPRAGRVRNLKR